MKHLLRTICIFAVVFLNGCEVSSTQGESSPANSEQTVPEQEDALTNLHSALHLQDVDRVIEAINEAKMNQTDSKTRKFILQLWANEAGLDSNFNREFLHAPEIRIELANLIAQYDYNGFINADEEQIRSLARDILKREEHSDRMSVTALLTLGIINHSEDTNLLKEIALEKNPRTIRPSIVALVKSCDPMADVALNQIKDGGNLEVRELINTQKKELSGFKRCPKQMD